MNQANEVLEVYKSALKYFDSKGYIVNVPDGTINCVEISNSPSNEVEICFDFKATGTTKRESGKYTVHGDITFTLSVTEETDFQFADQIMNDMNYFMEHFIGTNLH